MTRRSRRAVLTAALLAAGGVAVLAAAATAVVPRVDKITDAIARANRKDKRAEPLLLQVKLHIGDGDPVATGTLASHPTGLARLELESRRGFIERHLLQGSSYGVSRDGQLLAEPPPWPLLAPVFLLQSPSGAALDAALESYGVEPETAVMGRVGDHDCYVLGGRPAPAKEREGKRLASIWVDQGSYEVVRIDRPDGSRTNFGPLEKFGEIVLPRWIEIEVPDRAPARLDIEKVVRADAPAAAFSAGWLTAE